MKKRLFVLGIVTLVSTAIFAQTSSQKVDAAKTSPKAAENSAKADVRVAEDKSVTKGVAYRKYIQEKRRVAKAKRRNKTK